MSDNNKSNNNNNNNNGSPLFSNLCTLIERMAETNSTTGRKRHFERYLYDYRSQYGYDFYNAMRLLLPHVNKNIN